MTNSAQEREIRQHGGHSEFKVSPGGSDYAAEYCDTMEESEAAAIEAGNETVIGKWNGENYESIAEVVDGEVEEY